MTSEQIIVCSIICYILSFLFSSMFAWNPDSEMRNRHYAITILLVITFIPIVGLPFLWAIGKTREQIKENKKL